MLLEGASPLSHWATLLLSVAPFRYRLATLEMLLLTVSIPYLVEQHTAWPPFFFFFWQGQTPRLGHRGSATAMPQPRTGPGSRAQVPRAQEKVRSFSITPCGTYSRDSALSAVRLLIDPDSRGHFSGAILPQRYRLLLHDATCMVKCCRSLLIVARL